MILATNLLILLIELTLLGAIPTAARSLWSSKAMVPIAQKISARRRFG